MEPTYPFSSSSGPVPVTIGYDACMVGDKGCSTRTTPTLTVSAFGPGGAPS